MIHFFTSLKKVIFFVLFLHIASSINAQSSYFDIYESVGVRDLNGTSIVKAIHTASNENVGLARFSKNNLIFDVYNNEGTRIHNQFSVLSKKENFIAQLYHDDLLKIFTIHSPEKTERIIYCYVLDIKNKSLKKITLFNTSIEKKQKLFSGQNRRQTNWAISPNNDFFVFATDNIKKNSNSYKIHVFDSQSMNLVYETAYFENTEQFYISHDIAIDNNAVVYSIGKEYIKGRSEIKILAGRPNYKIILNKINKDNIIVERINLDENQHITDLRIIQKEQQLNVYGFYSEKKAGRITGLNRFIINKQDISKVQSKKNKLPIEIFSDLHIKENVSTKKEKDLKNYYLDHVLEDDKGNTILMAEEFYITSHLNDVNGGFTYVSQNSRVSGGFTYVPHYDDILIVKLNNDGEIMWGRSIFKRDEIPSYNAFLLDDKLHVLFNSGKKLKVKNDGRVKASTGIFESTSLYDYIYDENGEVTQEKLKDNTKKTTFTPFLGSYQNGKFIMFNQSKEERKVMILKTK